MADDIVKVDSLLYENGALRNYCRGIGKLLSEQEAIFLQNKGAWTPDVVEALVRQKLNLEHTMLNLEESLETHRQLRSQLPESFMGTLLAEALEMEHKYMCEAIRKAKQEITGEIRHLSRAEMLAKGLQMRSAHESACVLVESHLSKVDAILELLRKVLRAAQGPDSSKTHLNTKSD